MQWMASWVWLSIETSALKNCGKKSPLSSFRVSAKLSGRLRVKVYVAGKIGDSEPSFVMDKVRERGHEITFDWTTFPHLKPYEENIDLSAEAAVAELDGVIRAEAVLFIQHERGVGMYVELGAALIMNKPIIAVVPEAPRSMFLMHPKITRVRTLDDALDLIDGIAEAYKERPGRQYATRVRAINEFGSGSEWG